MWISGGEERAKLSGGGGATGRASRYSTAELAFIGNRPDTHRPQRSLACRDSLTQSSLEYFEAPPAARKDGGGIARVLRSK